jgi:zona occludens toxin (predicted ATPase)
MGKVKQLDRYTDIYDFETLSPVIIGDGLTNLQITTSRGKLINDGKWFTSVIETCWEYDAMPPKAMILSMSDTIEYAMKAHSAAVMVALKYFKGGKI